MAAPLNHTPYTLGPDDKVAQVMAYTANALYWGEVVVRSIIRVSTWLRTNNAPDRLALYNVKVIYTQGSAPSKPLQFSEVYLATTQVLAFHMTPPARDPVDYDPTEPNRRMLAVTMLVGSFRVDGHLRLAERTNLSRFLEATRENFTAVYDAKVSNPANPAFGVINTPFLLVRQEPTVFIQV